MRNRSNAWWAFSHSELSGVIVLLILLIALFAFKVWFVPFYRQVDIPSEEEINKALVLWEKEKPKPVASNDKEVELFDFDPNQISRDSLKLLGFNEYLVNRFMNYRAAIGAFRNKEQVGKVYGLDSVLYAKLLPHMKFDSVAKEVESLDNGEKVPAAIVEADALAGTSTYDEREFEVRRIDLNRADQETFEGIYGIGEVLAGRIVKYRRLLGGFTSLAQIYEVYGVDSSNIDLASWQVSIALDQVNKIPINTADEKQLSKHPYLSWKEAKVIVNFRKQHGFYQSMDDLQRVEVIEAAKIAQLTGYLSFD